MTRLIDERVKCLTTIECDTLIPINWDVAWHFLVGERGFKFKDVVKDHYLNITKAIRSIPLNLPGTQVRKAINSKKSILQILKELIEANPTADPHSDNCLQAMADIAAVRQGNLEEQLLGLLFASLETTSSTLNGILWNLIHHPEVIEKAKQEVKQYPVPQTVADFQNFSYLNKVIRESMRMYSTNIINRENKEGVQFQDHYFPAGTRFLVATGYSHQEVSDPSTFNPDRVDSYKWEPFGTGPRNCLGKVFAQVQLKLILIGLLKTNNLIPEIDKNAAFIINGLKFTNARLQVVKE